MKLLIVPAVIAGGGIWFNRRQQARDQHNAEQRAQDDALEAYLDRMTELITTHNLGSTKSDNDDREVRVAARARTLTVLGRVDGKRAGRVLQFLYESDLINRDRCVLSLYSANLKQADLHGINLKGAHLRGADLRGANPPTAEDSLIEASILEQQFFRTITTIIPAIVFHGVGHVSSLGEYDLGGPDLEEVDLEGANLQGANLKGANLKGANLKGTLLSRADLFGANLKGACLEGAHLKAGSPFSIFLLEGVTEHVTDPRENALVERLHRMESEGPNLEEANLEGANLAGAYLFGANLKGTNLKGANLEKVTGITARELHVQANSLEGATMPSGQKYEAWLEDQESHTGNEG
jgi:uncharacterized protein YjbI with pentapeptide repeats